LQLRANGSNAADTDQTQGSYADAELSRLLMKESLQARLFEALARASPRSCLEPKTYCHKDKAKSQQFVLLQFPQP
jgi:hypothetical protein